jgi:uncharacterized protein with GYD domain
MPRYLSLIHFTDQGIRDIRDSTHRAEEFKRAVERSGGKTVDVYWAIGQYDGAVIFEAPSESAAMALLLNLGRQGFVRTQTLRVLSEAEFQATLAATGS